MSNQSECVRIAAEVRLKWVGIAMVVVSVAIGWFIPEFYEWSESEQSRLGNAVLWGGLAVLAGCLCLNLGLLWMHFATRSEQTSSGKPECATGRGSLQKFNLRQLFGLVTLVAVLLAIGRLLSNMALARVVCGMTIAWAIWVAIRQPEARWWIAMIVCLQYAPFLWVFRQANSGAASAEQLLGLPALPSMFVTVWLNFWIRLNFAEGMWINYLVTSLMFACGIWLASGCRKRTLAFGSVILVISIFGSFMLNALVRALNFW